MRYIVSIVGTEQLLGFLINQTATKTVSKSQKSLMLTNPVQTKTL